MKEEIGFVIFLTIAIIIFVFIIRYNRQKAKDVITDTIIEIRKMQAKALGDILLAQAKGNKEIAINNSYTFVVDREARNNVIAYIKNLEI